MKKSDKNMCIWLDEAGTLSKNPKNPPFFIYAGFWCLQKHKEKIISPFSRQLINMFPSCKYGEKKASSMKNRKKQILIKKIEENNHDIFHPIFVVEQLNKLHVPLQDKEDIQSHKNYLMRRFVEICMRQHRKIYNEDPYNVFINIDDQSRTQLHYNDAFPTYINKIFKNQYSNHCYFISNSNFEVSFKDSNKYRGIQICDILANCKYNYYIHDRLDLHKALNKNDIRLKKLPS